MSTKSTITITINTDDKANIDNRVVAKGAKKVASITFTNTDNAGTGYGRKPFSDEDYAADIRRVSRLLGYTDNHGNHIKFTTNSKGKQVEVKMSPKEYTNNGVFSAIAISKRFGSFAKFRDLHSHQNKSARLSDKAFIKEINRVLRAKNTDINDDNARKVFTPALFEEYSTLTYRTVMARFGTWDDVVKVARENDWDNRVG